MKVFDNKKCRFSSTHFNSCHVASFLCAFCREAAASMLLDHQAKMTRIKMTDHEQHEVFYWSDGFVPPWQGLKGTIFGGMRAVVRGLDGVVSDMSGVTSFCCCCLHDFVRQWSQDMSLTSRDPSCFIAMTDLSAWARTLVLWRKNMYFLPWPFTRMFWDTETRFTLSSQIARTCPSMCLIGGNGKYLRGRAFFA